MPASWQSLVQQIKRAALRLPMIRNMVLPRYPFMIEPDQLIWLCEAIDRTRKARAAKGAGAGCIVEVGVARGQTSAFLLMHMRHRGDNRCYYCIDTFRGFTPADVDHEISVRGKSLHSFHGFAVNDRDMVEQNLKRQGFANVVVIETDAGSFDWSGLPPIDVMLLDVDLYKPSKAVLVNSQSHWAPFARIMVDDVKTANIYDGAHQAYVEFCNEQGFPLHPVGGKAGIVVADERAAGASPPLAGTSLPKASSAHATRLTAR